MIYEKWVKDKWTESVPAPLELTDSEILDWMAETGSWAIWSHGKWSVALEGCRDVAKENLREAICLAAAYEREL